MQQKQSTIVLTRLVAYIVLAYGLVIITNALFRQLRAHPGHRIDVLLITVPQVTGLGFAYLGTLLLRRKYNAWLAAIVLFGIFLALNVVHFSVTTDRDNVARVTALGLPVLIVALLILTRNAFQVRSDVRNFTQAVRVSLLVLCIAFVYGMVGFSLLDDRDFHSEISFPTAVHQTVDQFGLTTNHAVAYTRRARLFLDSLPVISIAALGYVAISLFQPIRVRLVNQSQQREKAEQLLRDHPSDLDDFFKLWPHDKLYYFDASDEAGLAYHVSGGVALVVGNPFGNPKRFKTLLHHFSELCFVNDWLPACIHVTDYYRNLYEYEGFQLQQMGEEAVLSLADFVAERNDKYFRQIRNRFTKLGYEVEVLPAPQSAKTLKAVRAISTQWLSRPGREERGFMLGYFDETYLCQCDLAVLRDAKGHVQGFLNLVPTFEPATANYDLLRCSADAPGNANDFLMLGVLDHLESVGVQTFNLGLCPLSGLDKPDTEERTLIDQAMRFVYANGDRFYSFSGLRRFKAKYQPVWTPRYIAYPGGIRNFTRILTALNRAMKIK